MLSVSIREEVVAMNPLKCAGCPNKLKGICFLHCSRCSDKYHHTCLNISKEDFNAFSKDLKASWVCPSCRCKEPKRGDNSNTPIRSAATPTQKLVTATAAVVAGVAAPVVAAEATPATPAVAVTVADDAGLQHENITLRPKNRCSGSCTCVSADSIREIIREELDRKFHSELSDFNQKLETIEESIVFINSENERLTRENESQKTLIAELQRDNGDLHTTSHDLSHRLHMLEQLSRTNNIEVQCVPENKSENIYNTIQQLGSIIKCPVSDTDLQYCTRIAKLNTKSLRPRSILVKFSSRRFRDNFLASVTKFNKNNPNDKLNTGHLGIGSQKKSPVYVAEHLTREAKELHAATRRAALQLKYKFVWVRDGKVFLRKSETSGYIHIQSLESLKLLT